MPRFVIVRIGDTLRKLRAKGRTRRGKQGVAVLAMVGCLGGAAIGIGSAGGKGHAESARVVQVVSHERAALLPAHDEAGEGGWCLATVNPHGVASECPRFVLTPREGPFRGPIVVEAWKGQSATGSVPSDQAVILTTSEVAAVALESNTPVSTRASVLLPGHLRGSVIELRGSAKQEILGVPAPPPLPTVHFKALSSKGDVLPQESAAGPPLEFQLPGQNWSHTGKAPHGVCGLEVRGVRGLAFRSGSVMTVVKPHPDIRGREFVDCVRETYVLDKWPRLIEADVLLDAARPGTTPAQLPAITPVPGYPGTFREPGGLNGEQLARRVRGGWLVVSGGKGRRQCLAVLAHLRATVLPR